MTEKHASVEKTLWEISRHFLFFAFEIIFLAFLLFFPFSSEAEIEFKKQFSVDIRYHLVVFFTGFPLALSLVFFYHAFRSEVQEEKRTKLKRAGVLFLAVFLLVSLFIEKNFPGMLKTSYVEVAKFYKECISHMGEGYKENPCKDRISKNSPLFCS